MLTTSTDFFFPLRRLLVTVVWNKMWRINFKVGSINSSRRRKNVAVEVFKNTFIILRLKVFNSSITKVFRISIIETELIWRLFWEICWKLKFSKCLVNFSAFTNYKPNFLGSLQGFWIKYENNHHLESCLFIGSMIIPIKSTQWSESITLSPSMFDLLKCDDFTIMIGNISRHN